MTNSIWEPRSSAPWLSNSLPALRGEPITFAFQTALYAGATKVDASAYLRKRSVVLDAALIGSELQRVTEELQVEVAFNTPLKNFRLGEQSEVYITTEGRKSVPSLPSAALVSSEKKRGVWAQRSFLKMNLVSPLQKRSVRHGHHAVKRLT